jgi:hypothetical protein
MRRAPNLATRFESIDADGHKTEDAGRLKVAIGMLDEDWHGGHS